MNRTESIDTGIQKEPNGFNKRQKNEACSNFEPQQSLTMRGTIYRYP